MSSQTNKCHSSKRYLLAQPKNQCKLTKIMDIVPNKKSLVPKQYNTCTHSIFLVLFWKSIKWMKINSSSHGYNYIHGSSSQLQPVITCRARQSSNLGVSVMSMEKKLACGWNQNKISVKIKKCKKKQNPS